MSVNAVNQRRYCFIFNTSEVFFVQVFKGFCFDDYSLNAFSRNKLFMINSDCNCVWDGPVIKIIPWTSWYNTVLFVIFELPDIISSQLFKCENSLSFLLCWIFLFTLCEIFIFIIIESEEDSSNELKLVVNLALKLRVGVIVVLKWESFIHSFQSILASIFKQNSLFKLWKAINNHILNS